MHLILRPGLLLLALALPATGSAAGQNFDVLDDQRKISEMEAEFGSSQDNDDFDAGTPAVAASNAGQVLIVYSGDNVQNIDADGETERHLVDDEFEIFGHLYSATTNLPIGGQSRYSIMGSDATADEAERRKFAALNPAVAWNPVASEYLVVWEGDHDAGNLVDDEFEIFGLRIDEDGAPIGEQFRISVMGNDAATAATERQRFGAHEPAIAVNAETGQYLVVWEGDDNTAPAASGNTTVDDEFEIFGRVLNADGGFDGGQFRISTMGEDTEPQPANRVDFSAATPAVAYNPVTNGFVVAWQGDGEGVNGEHEIHAQLLDGSAALLGSAIRISVMGPDGDAAYDAFAPALAVNTVTGDTLVSWHGDDTSGALVEGEYEVHARILANDGSLPSAQFRVSVMGPDDETDAMERERFRAEQATTAWSLREEHYLVAWRADTLGEELVDDEREIFGRLVMPDGQQPFTQKRISVQGDDDETDAEERVKYEALHPSVAYAASAHYLVWAGDTDTGATDGDYDIYSTRAATVYTELAVTVTDLAANSQVTAPEPIHLPIVVSNDGAMAAENVRLVIDIATDWPMTLEGCDRDPADTDAITCIIGDMLPEDSATFILQLETAHLGLGDNLRTDIGLTLVTDTAISPADRAAGDFQARVTVEVEGGSGSVGWLWLSLGAVPLFVRRRRAA